MPIGKNSIKRVMNSGYSKVKTTAPDMENSHIEEEAKPAEAKAAPRSAAKKSAAKTAPKVAPGAKAAPTPDLSPASRLEVVVERVAPEAKDEAVSGAYVNLGRELPVHLL